MHSYITHTIYFVATAIKAVELRPHIVTAVFPTLLGLLTQGSFVLLPVVTLKRVKGSYSAQIKVTHTTYHSPRDPDRVAIEQRQVEYQARKDGKYCRTVPIFVDLINASKPFRLSNDKDRTVRCFETLLHKLRDLIEEHVREKSNCSGCTLSFREKSFKSACRTIMNITSVQKAALLEAMKCYEHFLWHDVMTYLCVKWQLDENPRPVPRYRFL